MPLKLDGHDSALVNVVMVALDTAIKNAHHPSAVAKRIHSRAAQHRMRGRAAAIKAYPFKGICDASNRLLDRKYAELDEMKSELGYQVGNVRWVCSRANRRGPHTCGGCE